MNPPIVDYPSPAQGDPPLPDERGWRTVTRWLFVACVALFLADVAFSLSGRARFMTRSDGGPVVQGFDSNDKPIPVWQPVLTSLTYFSVDKAILAKQAWRFFTYEFVHANVEHIVLNMFGLLMAGPLVEARMGRWRYLLFYLVCGAAGPAAHIALSQIGALQLNVYTPLVGASASIYGVMVAAARVAPDEIVELALPPIDVRLQTFVWVMIALSLAAVVWNWQNAGGHAAHLGGAVAGWYLSRHFTASPQPQS